MSARRHVFLGLVIVSAAACADVFGFKASSPVPRKTTSPSLHGNASRFGAACAGASVFVGGGKAGSGGSFGAGLPRAIKRPTRTPHPTRSDVTRTLMESMGSRGARDRRTRG